VERISKDIAIEVNEGPAVRAADVQVGEDHLVDAVIVPFVVGRHLIDPTRHAGVGIARPDRHRPLIVARTLLRVPGGGIARAIVDQVQLGIVGEPAPGAAATGLPLIALPSLEAGILADRLAYCGGLLGIDQELVVRTLRKAAPDPTTALEIVSGHMTMHAKLAARDSDQDF